jgi:HAD superfamily hydrolase (TIGR01509 family)
MKTRIKCRAVIFDRDGVVINTEKLVIDSAKKAFKELGFIMPDEDIPQIVGRSSTIYTDYFLKKWKFDPDKFRTLTRENFYKNIDTIPFFVETIKLIKSLYKKKIALALTTSAGKEGTMMLLKKAGIDYMFDEIITRDDCKSLKPDPEPYLLTADKLGIKPEFCVAIEDTSLGVESAKNAGMNCIAVPNDFTKGQDFSKADLVLNSGKDIEQKLEFI